MPARLGDLVESEFLTGNIVVTLQVCINWAPVLDVEIYKKPMEHGTYSIRDTRLMLMDVKD